MTTRAPAIPLPPPRAAVDAAAGPDDGLVVRRTAPAPRALALMLLACMLPAWLSIAVLAHEDHDREMQARAALVLAAAQSLRQQLDAAATRPGVPAVPADTALLAGLPRELGWTGGVQDPRGTVVVAAPGFERLHGEPLQSLAAAWSGGEREGLRHARTAAGVPVVVAFSRLQAGDAMAVVGATERALLADWQRWVTPLLVAIVGLTTAGVAAAAWMARRLWHESAGLARAATAQAETLRLLHARTRERDAALLAQAEAAREARRDPLTRLANRTAFLQRLEACIRHRAEVGGVLTVFFVDLDDFKSVNDRWGHAVGDALLCALATRLVGSVREADFPARLSGDEFAVLIDGLTAHEAEPIAQSLLARLSLPYGVAEHTIRVSASIGMATFPHDARDAASLLQAADAAMYVAKAAGKGDFQHSGWSGVPAAAPPVQALRQRLC